MDEPDFGRLCELLEVEDHIALRELAWRSPNRVRAMAAACGFFSYSESALFHEANARR